MPPVPKNRRWRPKNVFSKIPETISFYPQHFLMTFLVIENCNKISTHNNALAARRQIIRCGGTPINKNRSTKVGGGGAHKLAAARGSSSKPG